MIIADVDVAGNKRKKLLPRLSADLLSMRVSMGCSLRKGSFGKTPALGEMSLFLLAAAAAAGDRPLGRSPGRRACVEGSEGVGMKSGGNEPAGAGSQAVLEFLAKHGSGTTCHASVGS